MRKPLVASEGGFEAPSVKPVGDGGSAAQGLPARGVKATLGEGGGAKRVLVRVRGQGEPKPGSRGAGVVCRRPATAEQRRARRLSAGALCPGCRSGLRAKKTSLKGRGGLGGAHRGVVVAGVAEYGGRRRSPAAGCDVARGGRPNWGRSGLLDSLDRRGVLLASRRGRCAAPVGLGSSRATRPRRRSGSTRRS